jgi:hypothetical protein
LTGRYAKYASRPLDFFKEVMNVTFTPEIEALILSFFERPVTQGRTANGVGKSHGLAHAAVGYFLIYEDAQVYLAAAPPESNLRMILFGEIAAIVEKHPKLFRGMRVSIPGMSIRRASGTKSWIKGLTIPQDADPGKMKARFSGKHAPHMAFIFDESDGIPKEVFEATESCMSGGDTHMAAILNPRQQSGPMFQMEKKGQANVIEINAFTHPNVITGTNLIPGAVDRNTTIRRIQEWTRPLTKHEKPDAECFQVPDFLVGTVGMDFKGTPYAPLQGGWRKVEQPCFYYMVLGQYPAISESQLISLAWIQAAQSRYQIYTALNGNIPPRGVQPIQGLDVAEYGPDLSVSTLRYGSFVQVQDWWQGVDPLVTAERAGDIYLNSHCLYCNVDSTGVGAGVAPIMNRYSDHIDARRVMVQSSATEEIELGDFSSMRDQMLWGLREWLRTDRNACLPPDDLLEEELLAFTYAFDTKRRVKVCPTDAVKDIINRSPDRAMSLALTFADSQNLAAELEVQSYIEDPEKPRRYGLWDEDDQDYQHRPRQSSIRPVVVSGR